MGETAFWIRFTVAVLATWRLTHLLAKEDGPADLVVRLRAQLGSGRLGGVMDCFQCLSLWVAVPMAFFVGRIRESAVLVLTWLALSGAACLLERFCPEPLVIQPMDEKFEGGASDGMLRTETDDSRQQHGTNGSAAGHTRGAE
jgi:hypothetical protein